MTAEPANVADAAAPRGTRPSWLSALPILVLVMAIIGQGALMAASNIDRQTGSGFAMFSSVDFAGSRSVVATATYDGQPVTVSFPASLDDEVDQLLYAPTDARARALAIDLTSYRWSEQDGRVVVDAIGEIANVSVTVRALTADGRILGSEILAQGAAE